ncbi:MAG: relaxase domain-containing protein, partial [Actinomycetia bacterium]|nr:relaxase domain-containing protein [Actinomycetes bacterium]
PAIVEELWWLRCAHADAYSDDAGSWLRVGDWHDRQRPGVARRVRAVLGTCQLSRHTPHRDRPGSVTPPPATPLAGHAAAIAAAWATDHVLPQPTAPPTTASTSGRTHQRHRDDPPDDHHDQPENDPRDDNDENPRAPDQSNYQDHKAVHTNASRSVGDLRSARWAAVDDRGGVVLSVFRGHSVRYLTDEVAKAREGYYTGAVAAGEPPGLWWGRGADTLGLAGEVDADLMEAVFTHMIDPRDPASRSAATWGEAATLGSGHRKYRTAEQIYEGLLRMNPTAGPDERAALRAQAARSARQAVSFIDVTFSVPKSVTVTGLAFERMASQARAAGDETAAQAWDAHAKAVEDAVLAGARAALAYLQDHAGYSRVGHDGGGGGRWIDGHQFVVAQFLQHDSRERDPQWHVHNAILNRVLCADGVWRGLDGMAIDAHKAAAGAFAERVMEAHLNRSIGLRSQTRPDGKAREIVGVDPALLDLYSGRRRQIGPKAQELIRGFTESTGREPSSYERTIIFEQATLATRKAKSHDGETREEQFARWAEMARQRVAGGLVPLAEQLRAQALEPGEPAVFSPLDVIERAVAVVGESRQHYNRSDLFAAVCNALPGNLCLDTDEELLELLDGLTDAALERVQRLGPAVDDDALPSDVRLANGESAYRRHGSTRYSTPGQLAAERWLIAAAVQRGAAILPAAVVDDVVARYAESGRSLGADQEAALRGVLTSGAQIEVLTAAAGTGKSFVVGAIADAWTTRHDPDTEPGRVFGLA